MKKICSIDEIADMADNGEDISKYFTNKFEVKSPLKKTDHARTRRLLGISKGNWSKDIIKDREDRV